MSGERQLTHRWATAGWLPLLGWMLVILASGASHGHDFSITKAELVVAPNGMVRVDLTCDLDALALGVAPDADDEILVATLAALDEAALDARLERLRKLLARRVKLRADGDLVPLTITFPDHGMPAPSVTPLAASRAGPPSFLGTTARLIGLPPAGAEAITFMVSRAFPPAHLTVRYEAADFSRHEILEQGATSAPYPLQPEIDPRDAAVASTTVFARYMRLGFAHILPLGIDHVLFVLGLFFFGLGLRPLLLQVTAFTLAHTVTLALASLGLVALPATVVEPLIALSIAWVAVENVALGNRALGKDRRLRWRTGLVFAFGLLHGLGFASVLGHLGLPRDALLPALLAFNVGVELGQLAVLTGTFLLIGWARNRSWYRPWIAIPASMLIAATGLYWFVERLAA